MICAWGAAALYTNNQNRLSAAMDNVIDVPDKIRSSSRSVGPIVIGMSMNTYPGKGNRAHGVDRAPP
jgi:hypothetical protein